MGGCVGVFTELTWIEVGAVILAALAAAAIGMAFTSILERRASRSPVSIFTEGSTGTVFLFDGENLIDATPGARALLMALNGKANPWVKLVSYLSLHFAELEAQLQRLAQEGSVSIASPAGTEPTLLLFAELRGGVTKLSIVDTEKDTRLPEHDLLAQRALQEELDQLRVTMAKVPVLTWRERGNGEVIWANTAYLLRAGDILEPGQDLTWPLPRLFERTASAQGLVGQRQKLTLPNGRAYWFDLIGSAEGEGRLVFAIPIDATVRAEAGLRDFMQTLTKTFAHLHVGLAIFDSARQLQIFNPALVDLTNLPVDFLSLRPSLLSVLDAMRDRNMIPEPADYRNWRRQLVEMEKAAAAGLYEETWSLPGGQTYRVIGRPHPNGALALMIEDISGEMLRTRRYRADLELGQSVIDEVEEAIAVFSPAGHLVMSNTSYTTLWGTDPSVSVEDASLRLLCAEWGRLCAPSKVWSDLQDFAATEEERAPWRAEARLLDGRLIDCRFAPLTGSATLAAFKLRDAGSAAKQLVGEEGARRSA